MTDLAGPRSGRGVAPRGLSDCSCDGETSLFGRIAAAWAVGGVAALFAWAVVRLGTRGIATIGEGMTVRAWTIFTLLTAGFLYWEGYQTLDRRWVPAMIERARGLRTGGTAPQRLLAPLHALSLIGATRRGMLRAWVGTVAIIGAVGLVRALPEPWRGIIDFAVAAALTVGLASILRRLPGTAARGTASQTR